jgi:hypothetical protein
MGTVLHDRPDPGRQVRVIGMRKTASQPYGDTWSTADNEAYHPGPMPVLYHGTNHPFEEDHFVDPGHQTHYPEAYEDDEHEKYVHATPHLETAWQHADNAVNEHGGAHHVFEVEPTGKVTWGDEAFPEDFADDDEMNQHATRMSESPFRVVREIPYRGEPLPFTNRRQAAVQGHGLDPFAMAMHGLSGEDAEDMRDVIDHIQRHAPQSEPINQRDADVMRRSMHGISRMEQAGYRISAHTGKYPRGLGVDLAHNHTLHLVPEPGSWYARISHREYPMGPKIEHSIHVRDEDLPGAVTQFLGSAQVDAEMKHQREEGRRIHEEIRREGSSHLATDINGTHIDDHGDAPEHGLIPRAADPVAYDEESTEGATDPDVDKDREQPNAPPDDGGSGQGDAPGAPTDAADAGSIGGEGFAAAARLRYHARVPWTDQQRTLLHNFDPHPSATWGDFVPSGNFHNSAPAELEDEAMQHEGAVLPEAGPRAFLTEVAHLTMLAHPSQKSNADAVYGQLAEDYPVEQMDWIHHVPWSGPHWVPFDDIDWEGRHGWNAYHQPARYKDFKKKTLKKLKKGKEPKPAILVQRPGIKNQRVIDGHHRSLTELLLGQSHNVPGVWAWTAHVHSPTGPWDEFHARQFREDHSSDTGYIPGDDGSSKNEVRKFHQKIEDAVARVHGHDGKTEPEFADMADTLDYGKKKKPSKEDKKLEKQMDNAKDDEGGGLEPRRKIPGEASGLADNSADSAQEVPQKSRAWTQGRDPKDVKRLAFRMFTEAARSPQYGFEFTAAWRDVVAKAQRLRNAGRVRITAAATGYVIGEVGGDHDVYESGIQHYPGRPQSIFTWACGCPWASFHQDASLGGRYNGRPCSHVMALKFEEQARRMYGRELHPDPEIPRWIQHEVVVKSLPPWGAGGGWKTWTAPSTAVPFTGSVHEAHDLPMEHRHLPHLPIGGWPKPQDQPWSLWTTHPWLGGGGDDGGDDDGAAGAPAYHAAALLRSLGVSKKAVRQLLKLAGEPDVGRRWNEVDEAQEAMGHGGWDENEPGRHGRRYEDPSEVFEHTEPYSAAPPTKQYLSMLVQADQANAPWGSQNSPVRPPVKPYGATEPPQKEMDPGSYGFLAGPDPENWGSIDTDSATQIAPTTGHDAAIHRVECAECGGQVEGTSGPGTSGHCRSCGGEMAIPKFRGMRQDKAYPVIREDPVHVDPGRSAYDDSFLGEHGIQAARRQAAADDVMVSPTYQSPPPRDLAYPDISNWHDGGAVPYGDRSNAAGPSTPIEPRDPQGIRMEEALARALAAVNDAAPQLLGGLGAELHDKPEPALDPEGLTGAGDGTIGGGNAGTQVSAPAGLGEWGASRRDMVRARFGAGTGHVDPAGQYALGPQATGGGPGMSPHDQDLEPGDYSIQTMGQQQWSGGGSDSDEIAVEPGMPQGTEQSIVAAFQRSAASGQYTGGAAPGGDGDIARAAAHFLKTGELLTDAEAHELITEGRGQRARNLDLLDLDGTHYIEQEAAVRQRGLSLDDLDDDLVTM